MTKESLVSQLQKIRKDWLSESDMSIKPAVTGKMVDDLIEALKKDTLAALTPQSPDHPDVIVGYFEDLRIWGEETFGSVLPARIVDRAAEEMTELKEQVKDTETWSDKALEEAADVVVILTRAPGLAEAIFRKMDINYNRKWNKKGDGTGYHIPQPAEIEQSTPLLLKQGCLYKNSSGKIVTITAYREIYFPDLTILNGPYFIYIGSDSNLYTRDGMFLPSEVDSHNCGDNLVEKISGNFDIQ